MHWVWLIIVGLIVGALGRALHPGKDPMGWILTLALGVVSLIIAGRDLLERCARVRRRDRHRRRAARDLEPRGAAHGLAD